MSEIRDKFYGMVPLLPIRSSWRVLCQKHLWLVVGLGLFSVMSRSLLPPPQAFRDVWLALTSQFVHWWNVQRFSLLGSSESVSGMQSWEVVWLQLSGSWLTFWTPLSALVAQLGSVGSAISTSDPKWQPTHTMQNWSYWPFWCTSWSSRLVVPQAKYPRIMSFAKHDMEGGCSNNLHTGLYDQQLQWCSCLMRVHPHVDQDGSGGHWVHNILTEHNQCQWIANGPKSMRAFISIGYCCLWCIFSVGVLSSLECYWTDEDRGWVRDWCGVLGTWCSVLILSSWWLWVNISL